SFCAGGVEENSCSPDHFQIVVDINAVSRQSARNFNSSRSAGHENVGRSIATYREAPPTGPDMKNGSHMAEHSNGQAVSFSESAVPLIVKRGGITIQFNEGGVDVYTNLPVTVHPAANEQQGKLQPLRRN